MLTSRGWWLLLITLTLLGLGAVVSLRADAAPTTLLLVGLTAVLWFAAEWLRFAVQARLALRGLRIDRELRDERGPVTTFWAGRSFQVRLRATVAGPFPISFAVLTDRAPSGAERDGDPARVGGLGRGGSAEWSYRVRCPLPGAVRFEGVRVQIADVQGFFYFETFLRRPVRVPVLPTLVDAEARRRTTKRFNLLPPPGVHRHRRSGNGSELLELRDYRPGDPPKRIAWKASAKRDRIITREFESEVPIRCTLFVDTSPGVRLGPPGHTALAGLTSISAAVAQAAVGNRDLVGLALCDEAGVQYVAPARTPAHLIGLLHRLAGTAELAPHTDAADLDDLLPRAYRFAAEVYPDLMRPALNRVPFWLPILFPKPAYTDRSPRHPLTVRRLLVLLAIMALPALALFAAMPRRGALPVAVTLFGGLWFVWALARWLPRAFSGKRQRQFVWRKRLAALLAVRYRLGPGGLATLLEDDADCARWLQRFLAEHQVPFDVPLYDARGRYQLAGAGTVEALERALLRSVSRGHDNELFVILADLLDLDDRLTPLLKAVQVARSRHHQVLVVCAWPAGLPVPVRGSEPPARPPAGGSAAELVAFATRRRAVRAWQTVRREFGRLGVSVLSAAQGDPARVILHRIDLLRTLQGTGRS